MYSAMIIINNVNSMVELCNNINNVIENINIINNGAILIKSKKPISEITEMLLNSNINSIFIIIDLDKITEGGIVYHVGKHDNFDLDKILDKINKSGYDSLTKKEKIYLENYGK